MSTRRERKQLKAKRGRKLSRSTPSLGQFLDGMMSTGADAGEFIQPGPNGKDMFVEFFPAERLGDLDDVEGSDK